MNKKFKILENDTIKFNGKTLYRIEALKDFGDVSKGDKGGYIEKEENLSTTGDAWVGGDAYVTDNAYVTGNAYVADEAWVYGDAIISGNARLLNNARVYGNAQVSENAKVSDEAWVSGNAKVSGNVQVTGEAWVTGEALVSGNAHLSSGAQVSSEADFLVVGPIGSEGRYLTAFKSRNEKISVIRGGFDGTLEEFEEAVNKLYGDNKCGKEYRVAIELVRTKLGDLKNDENGGDKGMNRDNKWRSLVTSPPKKDRVGDIFEIDCEHFKEPILAKLGCDANGRDLYFVDMYGSGFTGYINYREVMEMRKDKEWLKEEVWKQDTVMSKGYIYTDDLMSIINELDEPEKPVIPQFVADWIEVEKAGCIDKYVILERFMCDYNAVELPNDLYNYYDNNKGDSRDKVINAILYGYELEKEKKYYVDLDTAAYVAKWKGDNQVGIYTADISGSDDFEFHLTEKEIKDYDKRFWAFAEDVME